MPEILTSVAGFLYSLLSLILKAIGEYAVFNACIVHFSLPSEVKVIFPCVLRICIKSIVIAGTCWGSKCLDMTVDFESIAISIFGQASKTMVLNPSLGPFIKERPVKFELVILIV